MSDEVEREPGFLERAGSMAAAVYHAVFRDGTVDAFLRQGAGELGEGLKAFPSGTIQHDEAAAVFNPLYADIAAEMKSHASSDRGPSVAVAPSPSEIAMESRGSVYGPDQPAYENVQSPADIARESPGSIYGQAPQGLSPSPSEIANEQPSPSDGQVHGHEHELGRGGR